MNSDKLDACRGEIQSHLAALAPEAEGFDDFAAVDLIVPAKYKNAESITWSAERKLRLDNAKAALDALTAHGFPEVPIFDADPDVYDDMENQIATMTAAFKRYKRGPGPATGGVVEIIPPDV